MSSVTAQGISKSYGGVVALAPLDLAIAEGEFLTLLGPSGCGKTTTLRLLAGFLKPTTGRIQFGGEDVTALAPQHRQIGMVFQDYALFPHMTIADNIGFGLVEQRRPRREVAARVEELLNLVHLPGIANRYPAELSGGQQQRVAVARAVAHRPRVLLMDEPLGALDLKLRESMQIEIRRIQQALRITTIYVTHDQVEAMTMSDRIAIMNRGAIEQIGSAADVYDRPRTRFVADFVGQINLLAAEKHGTAVLVAGQPIETPMPFGQQKTFFIGVRPEQMRLHRAGGTAGRNVLPGTVLSRQFAGNMIKTTVDIGAAEPVVVDCHPNADPIDAGCQVMVSWSPENAVVFLN